MEATINGKADSWRRRIDDQRASGQSVRAWCKANDIQEASYYWWRSRLGLSLKKMRTSKPAQAKPAPLAFAQVVVHPSTAEPPVASPDSVGIEPFRFRFAGQRELILPASMSIEQVARLLHAIESTT
jgi:hypothetical protein